MSTVIYPVNFSDDVTDLNRDRWTATALQAVSEALGGRKAALEVDTRTGCVHMGVTLDGMRGDSLLIMGAGSNPLGTLFPTRSLGMVLPLGEEAPTVKWEALRIFREWKSAAITAAAAFLAENNGQNWGTLRAVGTGEADVFTVTYEPNSWAPEGRTTGSRAALLVGRNGTGGWSVRRVIADYTEYDRRRAERKQQAGERAGR
ncbi:hypothetical protein [Streptomyces albogriseolus]|uniref:hypothetical protein n=1 Tax=Streptomyces albogriseolus TaxID=1887 RepID=UPI00345FDF8D